ncbi:MAG: hypothetical protein KKA05_11825, partial [Alphaproteobacteria bacterium]|nr:hypothetical protein [Alphaproteobacteria bacterium]
MTNQDGFFARIIRDALSSLPDTTSERQPLAFEQELQKVVEHSPVYAQSNLNAQTSAHMSSADETAPQSAPAPAPAASVSNVKAKPSSSNEQHTVALNETVTAKTVDNNAVNFPRNQRALTEQTAQQKTQQEPQQKAQQAAGKKIPLAITMRAAPNEQRSVPTAITAEPVQQFASAAAKSHLAAGNAAANKPATNVAATELEPANPTSQRQSLKTAAPIIAESAPVLAEHRLPERKAAPPTLRIGAVTIRVVERAPVAAIASRVNQPGSHTH